MSEPAIKYGVGQWVQSKPVGGVPAFNAEVFLRDGDTYIIRDSSKRRWFRTANQLEPLQ